jgi:hypothetical protein
VDQAEARGEKRLEAHGAGGGGLEGEALRFLVLRRVLGAEDVEEAGGQGLHGGLAVLLARSGGTSLKKVR